MASIKCFGVLSQEEVPNSVKAIHRITEFLWVMCAANKYSSANHHEKKIKKTTDQIKFATTHDHPQPPKNQNLTQLKGTVNSLSSAEKPIYNLLFLVGCFIWK